MTRSRSYGASTTVLGRGRVTLAILSIVLAPTLFASNAAAQDAKPAAGSAETQQDLDEIGRKLANPISDVWALFTEFDFGWNGGNATGGREKFFFTTEFQPVMPIKLTDDWKMITRPAIPIIWSSSVPDPQPGNPSNFTRKTELGDIILPLIPAPNKGLDLWGGELVGGLGPTFSFPTATDPAFGSQNWEVGLANVTVWKNPKVTLGVFPQWWWKVGGWGDYSSHGEILYFFCYNLPNAWQVGFAPTINIDYSAPDGDRVNLPVGITVAKTMIPDLIKKPLF